MIVGSPLVARALARHSMESVVRFEDRSIEGSVVERWQGPASVQSTGEGMVTKHNFDYSYVVPVQTLTVYAPHTAPARGYTHIVIVNAPDDELNGIELDVKSIIADTTAPYRKVIAERVSK